MKTTVLLSTLASVLVLASSASADLLAHWKLDETEGMNAADSSGNGHDGTLGSGIRAPTWQPAGGLIDGALMFDAEGNDYVDCGTFDSLEATGQMTISLWAKWSGPSGLYHSRTLLSNGTAIFPETVVCQLSILNQQR